MPTRQALSRCICSGQPPQGPPESPLAISRLTVAFSFVHLPWLALIGTLRGLLLSCKHFHQCLGRSGRRGWILPGDNAPIDNGKRSPVSSLLIEAADSLQLILYEEWNDVSEINRGFLAVGEAGNPFALHQQT